jgi:protein-L-isoaspartate(D-aspartate) O-methyltransferase
MTEAELAIVRRAYAKQITLRFNHPRVEAAFAAVRREAFVGPGPWPMLRSHPYVMTPDDDPVYLYQAPRSATTRRSWRTWWAKAAG